MPRDAQNCKALGICQCHSISQLLIRPLPSENLRLKPPGQSTPQLADGLLCKEFHVWVLPNHQQPNPEFQSMPIWSDEHIMPLCLFVNLNWHYQRPEVKNYPQELQVHPTDFKWCLMLFVPVYSFLGLGFLTKSIRCKSQIHVNLRAAVKTVMTFHCSFILVGS